MKIDTQVQDPPEVPVLPGQPVEPDAPIELPPGEGDTPLEFPPEPVRSAIS